VARCRDQGAIARDIPGQGPLSGSVHRRVPSCPSRSPERHKEEDSGSGTRSGRWSRAQGGVARTGKLGAMARGARAYGPQPLGCTEQLLGQGEQLTQLEFSKPTHPPAAAPTSAKPQGLSPSPDRWSPRDPAPASAPVRARCRRPLLAAVTSWGGAWAGPAAREAGGGRAGASRAAAAASAVRSRRSSRAHRVRPPPARPAEQPRAAAPPAAAPPRRWMPAAGGRARRGGGRLGRRRRRGRPAAERQERGPEL
jgi:hypothetical protein